jgi:hypothetical protein
VRKRKRPAQGRPLNRVSGGLQRRPAAKSETALISRSFILPAIIII